MQAINVTGFRFAEDDYANAAIIGEKDRKSGRLEIQLEAGSNGLHDIGRSE